MTQAESKASSEEFKAAEELAELMEAVNRASDFEEYYEASSKARTYGLYLRPGFYGQKRKIPSTQIEDVRSATSQAELKGILIEINYGEQSF